MKVISSVGRLAALVLALVALAVTAGSAQATDGGDKRSDEAKKEQGNKGHGDGNGQAEAKAGAKAEAAVEAQARADARAAVKAETKASARAEAKTDKAAAAQAKAAHRAAVTAKVQAKAAHGAAVAAKARADAAAKAQAKAAAKAAAKAQGHTQGSVTTSTPNQGDSSKVLTVAGSSCATPVAGAKVEGQMGTTISVSAGTAIAKVTLKSGNGATVVAFSFASDFKSGTITLSKDVSNYVVWTCGAAVTGGQSGSNDDDKGGKQDNGSKGRSDEAHHHVVICHRTGSDSNPYVVINIPWTAWTEAHSPDTGSHPDLNGRSDILLKNPASGPGSKDGFTKEACASAATTAQVTDVCPNIQGMQTQLPAGLVKDALGNCVTPTAAASADVCLNVEGMQTTVPAGLIRNEQGNCVAPTASVTVNAAVPATGVLGSATPATPAKKAAAAKKAVPAATQAAPAATKEKSGVLGAVQSAPEAVTQTATGTLPFTGIPLWIVALFGFVLVAAGLAFRGASQRT